MAKLRVKDKVGLGNLVLLAATDEKTEESLRANPSDLLKRFIEDLPEDHIIKVIKEESNVSYIVIPARDSVPTSIEEKEQILREEAREYDQVRSNVENSKKRGGEAGEGSSIPAEVTENAYALMIGHTALSPSSRPRVTSEHAHSLGRMLMPQEVNFQPGHGTAGRHPTREFLDFLSGHDDPGMFGRMFPRLKPLVVTDEPLHELAEAMKDADPAGGGDNPIPAGFTYLGQFIDHDITLDLTSIGEKQADPKATENFRTPALDLDSIYGLGPDGSRQLYARNAPTDNGKNPGPKFLIGKNINVPLGGVTGDHRNDLPRSPEGFALIGDHRNDENLVVAQTHLAMLKFHNKICDMVMGGGLRDPVAVFNEARRLVTWHYQWMVLHDFVERLTEPGIVDKILHEGRRFYRFKRVPYIPVEFSAAAYRLGHSMVRQVYSYNRIFTPGGVTAATLALLFRFTGLSGGIVGDLAPNTPTDPTPISVLPSNWIIDWRRFYDFAPPCQSSKCSAQSQPQARPLCGGAVT